MRKILLFGFTALVSFGATAQSRTSNLLDLGATPAPKTLKTVNAATLNKLHAAKKKTRANTVRYNIVDYVAAEHGIAASDMYAYEQSFGGTNPNGRMVTNYLWPDSTMKYEAASTTGITFNSIGQVLDPTSSTFRNSIQADDVVIGPGNAYSVDSFGLFCSYVRNPAMAGVVDTLILSFVTEDSKNLPVSGWTSGNVVTNFGADTVTFLEQNFDSLNAKPPVAKNVVGGAAPFVIKKFLDQAAADDTISGGWNYYQWATNLNIPAGRAVSVSISFKPGTTWTPFVDTIGRFNNFSFVSHEENVNSFFTYTKRDYNVSQVVTKFTNIVPNVQGWGGTFVPSLAYTAPYAYELHNMDWIITCNTCKPESTNDITSGINVSVSPNPVSENAKLSVRLIESAKNVNVTFTNAVGQVSKSINLGAIGANNTQNFNVNVSDLSKGMYIYTVTADGKKTSGKLMVN